MKKTLLLIVLTIAIVGCQKKEPKEFTILGFGTPYIFVPEFMKGKVKEVKEVLYTTKELDGQVVKNNLCSWKLLDSLGFSHSFSAQFDENGIITKFGYLEENGIVPEYWTTTIQNGLVTQMDHFSKGKQDYYLKFHHNKNKCIEEILSFRPVVDTLLGKWLVTNNNKCQYTKFEYFNYKNIRTGSEEMERNEMGRIIKRNYLNKKDSITYTENNTYTDLGFCDSQSSFAKGKNGTKWTYKYTFEGNGNWANAIISKDGTPILFVERNYIYY